MMSGINCNNVTLYVKDEQTNELLELGHAEKIELTEEVDSYDTFGKDNNIIGARHELSVSYKAKKLTRKKFIKLLMARKIQRNAANELAKHFLIKRGYYSYLDLILFDGGVL